MNYLVLSVVLAALIGGAFGQFTFSCGQEAVDQGVDECPRKNRIWPLKDDPDGNMKCCIINDQIVPIYGCCAGMPAYVYGGGAGVSVILIISIALCCWCCCRKKRQQPGFIMFQNPPVVVQAAQQADRTRPV
ncbi:uncharacterized protein LOC135498730 [Lineus longissimus]|uniref:uncharacterized protein LOC135498730 n=1 Tax=Lineus longissimus TaxID=88925 RepID=UPI002B4D5E76